MKEKRMPFICGNWKMHKTVGESLALVDGILAELDGLSAVELGVAPPFTALHAVAERIRGSRLRLAAQNVHGAESGAYTGEVSVAMLKDVGCDYVLIGHSERRSLFGETDASTADKVVAAKKGGLNPILCVGETLEERDQEKTLEVVRRQFRVGLGKLSASDLAGVVVAYEPVWAIGTGRTATPEQAQEVHKALRAECGAVYGESAGASLRIQYGGSMKPKNAAELLAQVDIDGGLIGGAALEAGSFLAIGRAAAGSA